MQREARQTLTKTLVEQEAPDPAKDVWLWDRDVRGFGVRVTPKGRRSYVFQYRTKDGQQRRERLGEHGAITVQQARGMARDRYGLVHKGYDPVADDAAARAAKAAAQEAQEARQTVADVLDEFMRRYANKLADHTRREFQGVFDREVKPAIGATPIADLRRIAITRMLDAINDRHGAVMADRTLKYLRRALNWHQARDDDFVCPIVRGMARTKPREQARTRVLSDDELRALWAATEGAGAFGALVRLILLSGQRPGEVAAMRRDEIQNGVEVPQRDGRAGVKFDGVLVIPAAKYKGRRDQAVPLSAVALDIIASVPARPDGAVFSPWLQKSGKAKARLDKVLPIADWVLHDCRRTASTLMHRAGVRPDVVERTLGHVIAGVAGVYNRYAYLDEKRAALEALSAQLDRILHPVANVTELRVRAAQGAGA